MQRTEVAVLLSFSLPWRSGFGDPKDGPLWLLKERSFGSAIDSNRKLPSSTCCSFVVVRTEEQLILPASGWDRFFVHILLCWVSHEFPTMLRQQRRH